MLELIDVGKTYPKAGSNVPAITSVTLRVDAGEFVAVQGPSGAGKTTLLLVAGALLRPDQGTVRVGGDDVYQLSNEARARLRALRIGFVFQQFHLIPYLSALENILAAGVAHGGPDLARRAETLAEELGLTPRRHHLPSELSSGERQRVALARALLHNPSVLLADEPTGNLDEQNAVMVFDRLASFAQQDGAVLLVTHDKAAAGRATRRCVLEAGRLSEPRP
ncbi:MAG: ABC transporter ATP-binding protein [Gemmataceae bacterium]|nr:ABC transporter ATP-binding protein [Gemmataceae bacterium]MCI0738055.1 ABC transporter ATP-binding protein [Gemmataceae bacterium]